MKYAARAGLRGCWGGGIERVKIKNKSKFLFIHHDNASPDVAKKSLRRVNRGGLLDCRGGEIIFCFTAVKLGGVHIKKFLFLFFFHFSLK